MMYVCLIFLLGASSVWALPNCATKTEIECGKHPYNSGYWGCGFFDKSWKENTGWDKCLGKGYPRQQLKFIGEFRRNPNFDKAKGWDGYGYNHRSYIYKGTLRSGQFEYKGTWKTGWHGLGSGLITFCSNYGSDKTCKPTGITYTGEWKMNRLHGHGKYTLRTGNYYIGKFSKGDFVSGTGTAYYPDGTIDNEGVFMEILKYGSDNRSHVKKDKTKINEEALLLKNVSVGMTAQQSQNRLINKGYSCRQNNGIHICVLGKAEIKIGSNGIDFTCENFNLCGHQLQSAASSLNDHFLFPNGMDYDPEMLLLADGEIPRYCGRGKAGDILCVKKLSMLIPLSVTLRKGSISEGGVSFD